ncbi:MAG TPA: hypothetical protein EYG92_05965 [Lutibacter sp.]|nr:hypothetical protein [Lutibacter sp.]
MNQNEINKSNKSTLYRINNEKFYDDKNNWIVVSKEIIGKGNENYIVIGNFNKNSKTEKKQDF